MKKILVWIIIAVVIGSILIGGIGNTTQRGKASMETRGYTTHGPIYIDSDSQFDSKHGVVGGSGTPDDPYIISGWDIDAKSKSIGIDIEGTSAFFIIEYCYIHDGGTGIYLKDVSHGTIENNNISYNSGGGIYVYKSDFIIIEDNIFYLNTGGGVAMDSSSHNTITENDFINNGAHDAANGVYIPQAWNDGANNWNGNYWSDYSGSGSYKFGGGGGAGWGVDRSPLTSPVNPTVEPPEGVAGIPLSYLIIAVVLIAIVIIAVVVVKSRKRKK